jgi:uncharacterized protein (TIGR02001 family)
MHELARMLHFPGVIPSRADLRRLRAMHKKALLTTAMLSTAAFPAVSMAELTANAGWVSDYIFRGVFQEDSSPYGGIDWSTESGIYAGVWGADVEIGLEYDIYFGYSGSFGDSFGFTVGFTGYYYTEDGEPTSLEPGFDDEYEELNLGLSFGIFSLEYADGEWGGFGTPADYTFTSVIIAPEVGPYYSYNSYGGDSDGDYIEVGYGFSGMDVDFSIALLYNLDAGEVGSAIALDEGDAVFYDVASDSFVSYVDTAITFGVSKSFTLGGD